MAALAASTESFPTSTRFRSACRILTTFPLPSFSSVLKRLSSRVHLRSSTYFTPSESSSLASQFGVTPLELSDCLNACGYALEQCAYSSVGGEGLERTLLDAGMGEGHAGAFRRAWEKEGQGIVNNFRDGSGVGTTMVMRGVEWSLGINMGNSGIKNTREATARRWD
ncbi:hypothetical protein TrRE_jg3490 [Triparma retinervis]|uniref:Uncharacterized protein n=1 Tax=Triparma retinervis TaxID=2557542 RepID=A0A9W7CCV8_9STRA|nr:hypothetical protein TrRE_jg3490 [Triparma retinervis]